MKKIFTMQIIAYSKHMDIEAETEDEAHEIIHSEHSLQDLGIEDTDSKILNVKDCPTSGTEKQSDHKTISQ